jgi:hypothetical protein
MHRFGVECHALKCWVCSLAKKVPNVDFSRNKHNASCRLHVWSDVEFLMHLADEKGIKYEVE